MTIWIIIQIVLSCICFFVRNRVGFLFYQLGTAFAYLVSLAMVQELDYTMSVYYAFSLLPYLRYFRIRSKSQLLLATYLALVSIYSIAINGVFPVASSLIVHFIGPLVLLYVFVNVPRERLIGSHFHDFTVEDTVKTFLILTAIGETIVGLIAISQSSDGRLMLNYQCVSGCLSCICIALVSVLLKARKSVLLSYCLLVYMVGWTTASGTRGYIVLAIIMSLFVVMRYGDTRTRIFTACIALAVVCVVTVIYWDEVTSLVMDEMRFGESTGRRDHENAWFINLFASQGPIKDLLGIGVGTTYSSQAGAEAAWFGVGESVYTHSVVMSANFLHNFWFMSVLAIGVVGTLLYVSCFIQYALLVREQLLKREYCLIIVFMLAYAFVLWYRWTATGGMLESAVLAAFLMVNSNHKMRNSVAQ